MHAVRTFSVVIIGAWLIACGGKSTITSTNESTAPNLPRPANAIASPMLSPLKSLSPFSFRR